MQVFIPRRKMVEVLVTHKTTQETVEVEYHHSSASAQEEIVQLGWWNADVRGPTGKWRETAENEMS